MNLRRLKYMFLLIVFFIISTFIFGGIYAFSPSGETYQGIDVSVYQGYIDYREVKEDGIEFVYIRSSEGTTYIDSFFRRNYEEAKRNGLKVGFYHYLTARTIEDAKEEAKFFVDVIRGTSPDLRLAMDFESFGNLNREEINEIAKTFLETVRSLSGKEVIIYSNAYDAGSIFNESLNIYPIWIAEYEIEQPVPNYKWETWAVWQYTSTGRIRGINGYVDRDLFTKESLLNDTSYIPGTPSVPTEEKEEIIYIVRYGDTLNKIASEYGVSVEEIVRLNNIPNSNLIYVGEKLVIKEGDSSSSTASSRIVYTVRSGDTLNEIAIRYSVTVNSIIRLNNISNPNLIYPGERLIITSGRSAVSQNAGTSIYVVRAGDTLGEIARRYNTTVNTLVRLNGIRNPNLIYVGERIRVTTEISITEEHDTNHTLYIVKYGDTLNGIARKYGTNFEELARFNNISNPNLIYAGERIRIP